MNKGQGRRKKTKGGTKRKVHLSTTGAEPQKAAESRELYRTLVDTAQEAIILGAADDTILYANPTAAQLLGIPQEELKGRSLLDFLPGRERKKVRSQTARRRKGETSRYEISMISRDGELRRVLVNAAPVYDRDGNFYAAMGVFTDITELTQTREELDRRSRELEVLLEASNQVSALLDEREVARLSVEKAARLIGADECTLYRFAPHTRELIPLATTVETYSEALPDVRIPLNKGIMGRAAVRRQVVVENNSAPDNQSGLLSSPSGQGVCVMGVPLVTADELYGVMVLARPGVEGFDEHHARLSGLFARQVSDAASRSFLFHKLRELNEKLEERVSERTAELEEAKERLQEVHTEYKQRVASRLALISPVMEKVSMGDFTQNIQLPAEEDEFTELIVGLNLMIDDLRFMFEENRKRSKELRELNQNLENMVAERTSELEQTSQRNAAFARELEEIIYVASHDLKTPLRAISGFGHFLYEDYRNNLDKEGRLYVDRIIAAAKRMEKLLDDLLEVSAVSRTGKSYKEVPAGELIEKAIELTKPGKEVRISWEKDSLPRIYCDTDKMVEVFANLISNGIKFNRSRIKKVKITAREREGFVEFSVEDNGIGIEKRHHEKIFQLFQRLHQRGEYAGTGVGLSLVKRVIGEHNGRVWVESEPAKHTIFHFTLPRFQGEPEKSMPERREK